MSYEIHCADVVDGCEFHIHSADQEEVIRIARNHAKAQHAMTVDHDGAKALVKTV
jgi:predicted small metal-binding protein